jgi:hypothetical protein
MSQFNIELTGTAADPVLKIRGQRPNIPGMIAHIEAAIGLMPYQEDVEAASQEKRDLMLVQELLRRAKSRLATLAQKRQS